MIRAPWWEIQLRLPNNKSKPSMLKKQYWFGVLTFFKLWEKMISICSRLFNVVLYKPALFSCCSLALLQTHPERLYRGCRNGSEKRLMGNGWYMIEQSCLEFRVICRRHVGFYFRKSKLADCNRQNPVDIEKRIHRCRLLEPISDNRFLPTGIFGKRATSRREILLELFRDQFQLMIVFQ